MVRSRPSQSDHKAVVGRIERALQKESDRRIQISVCVGVLGEPLVQIAKTYGYRDASGPHHVVRCLDQTVQQDKQMSRKRAPFRRLANVKS